MCLGTTCNLNPALHTAIFLFACHRENFLGSKWIWIWKEWRRWRNKNPLWWGAWKIYSALKARRLVLYLSGPELSSLKAGVYQRDRRPLMCISQLVGWKLRISKAVPAYNVSAWISHLSLTKVVTKISQKRILKKKYYKTISRYGHARHSTLSTFSLIYPNVQNRLQSTIWIMQFSSRVPLKHVSLRDWEMNHSFPWLQKQESCWL